MRFPIVVSLLFPLFSAGCSIFEPDGLSPVTVTNKTHQLIAVRPAVYIDSIPDDPFPRFTVRAGDLVIRPDSSVRLDEGNFPDYRRGVTVSFYVYGVSGQDAVYMYALRMSYDELKRSGFKVVIANPGLAH